MTPTTPCRLVVKFEDEETPDIKHGTQRSPEECEKLAKEYFKEGGVLLAQIVPEVGR